VVDVADGGPSASAARSPAIAVLMFVAIAVGSVFFGEEGRPGRARTGRASIPQGILRLPPQTHSAEASAAAHRGGHAGHPVLVFVFLAVFIL